MSDIRRDRLAAPMPDPKRISWGAVIAGTLLALAIQFMLGLLGLGIGLSTITGGAGSGTPSLANFASVAGLWTVAVVLVGLFVGAFAAGRLAGRPSRTDAALHGLVTWASATLIVLLLLANGTSAVVSGAFGVIGNSIQGLSQAAATMTPSSESVLPPSLRQDARRLLEGNSETPPPSPADANSDGDGGGQPAADTASQDQAGGDLSEAIATIVEGLDENATGDERQAAIQLIAERAGISQQQAQQRLLEFQQRYDAAAREARQAADAAGQAVSTASFAAFVALLLGMIVGALGAVVGKPKRVF